MWTRGIERRSDHDYHSHLSYKFEYGVKDPHTGDHKSQSSRDSTLWMKPPEPNEWLSTRPTSTTASRLTSSEWVMLTTRKCMGTMSHGHGHGHGSSYANGNLHQYHN
uniref:Uncharacterized protein n=1 Tax=Anopheles melas TaxID=34690 RepID=A0A182TK74_9DIPT